GLVRRARRRADGGLARTSKKMENRQMKLIWLGLVAAALSSACTSERPTGTAAPTLPLFSAGPMDPAAIAAGQAIFPSDTYGDEAFWTDTLRLHEVIRSSVSPATALAVGLKVDVDALPPAVKAALEARMLDLNDPATTVALLKLNAVLGVVGTVDANNT